jgi:hypothetical protein
MALGGILAFLGGLAGGIGKSVKDKKDKGRAQEAANDEVNEYIRESEAKGIEPDIREIQRIQKQGQGASTGEEYEATSLANRQYADAKKFQEQREIERRSAMTNLETLLGQSPKYEIPDAANKYTNLMTALGGMALNNQDKSGGIVLPDMSQFSSSAVAPDVWRPSGTQSLIQESPANTTQRNSNIPKEFSWDDAPPGALARYSHKAYEGLGKNNERRSSGLMDMINQILNKRKSK